MTMRNLILLALAVVWRRCANATTCNGTIMTDVRRDDALIYHISVRSMLQNKELYDNQQTVYPTAENLYAFEYDCELEKIADALVQGCQRTTPNNLPPEHAVNFEAFSYPITSFESPLQEAINVWLRQAGTIKATNKFDENIKELSNVLNWKSLYLGCSMQSCGGGIISTAACAYEERALNPGEEIYTIGLPCYEDGKCTAHVPASCDDFQLCKVETTTTTTSMSSSTTTAVTVATTTTAASTTEPSTTVVNAHPNPGVNQICPTNAGMNDRIRTRAIEMHNYRRSQLANGKVSKFNGNQLPSAANMIKLRYDCTLESTASAHASTCSSGYSDPSTRPGIGENIHTISGTSVPYRVNAMEETIKFWWRQIRIQANSIGMAVTYKQVHVNHPISHFTMMGWATTSKLGCGVAKCNGSFFVVCQYYPSGNNVNHIVYATGAPCTQCPTNTYCNSPLCVAV